MTLTQTAYPRGSEWRKWDLHVHTPSSFDYSNKSITNEQLVQVFKSKAIAVVAVTDHHTIDVARIQGLRKLAGEDITILAGIELRSELGGGPGVHYVGILPDNADLADAWTRLQGQLKLTPTDISAKGGDQHVYVPFVSGANAIHDLGGIVTVHAGKMENSIERIADADEFKQQVKEDLAREHVDALEIGHPRQAVPYREIVFPDIGFEMPLLICSDDHNAANYPKRQPCWIKADPTFAGLKMALKECSGRIDLSDTPKIFTRVREEPGKFVSSVAFAKVAGSGLQDEYWFDGCMVPLNPGFVAVIGRKGSGKSALTESIALLSETRLSGYFSFLTPGKFRDVKLNKAKHFEATLTWQGGNPPITRNLDGPCDTSNPEMIKYIPQNYLEKICTELQTGEGGDFNTELQDVIFSHVTDKQGKSSFGELLKHRVEVGRLAAARLRSQLKAINAEVVCLEEKLRPEHRTSRVNELNLKQNDLQALETGKPVPVQRPEEIPGQGEKQKQVEGEIALKRQKIKSLEEDIAGLKQEQSVLQKKVVAARKLYERLTDLQRVVDDYRNDCSSELAELGLQFGEVVEFRIVSGAITDKEKEAVRRLEEIAAQLGPDAEDSLQFKLKAESEALVVLQSKLGEEGRKYEAYRTALEEWEKKKQALIGADDIPGTVKFLEAQVKECDGFPAKLEEATAARETQCKKIYQEISKEIGVYRELYRPVANLIESPSFADAGRKLDFNVSLSPKGFEDKFFNLVSRASRGTFRGKEEGLKFLRGLLNAADFGSEAGMLAFVNSVLSSLQTDKRPESGNVPVPLAGQLLEEKTVNQLYDLLFSLEYLEARYRLRWAGKELERLSPGERGTVLLVFYLLIDKRDVPLIIDQPDDNLDNQTVVELLVPGIQDAKTRRQVVVVTHNPNLAVVCDADQVICADVDTAGGNRITYLPGSLENPKVNRKIVDVLEGTKPAFKTRDKKYEIVGVVPGP